MGETATGSDGNGSQLDLAGGIAESVNVLDGAVLVLVNLNVALVVDLDTGFLQTDAACLGGAADGPDEMVDVVEGGLGTRSVLVGDGQLAVGVLFDLGGVALLVQVDADALVLLGDRLLDHGVKAAQEGVATDEQVSLSAKGVEHASKLDGNVASTDNGDLLGLRGNVEEAVRVDSELGAGDGRGSAGLAADGDEDLLGVDENLGAVVKRDLDLVLGDETAAAVEVLNLVVAEVALVDAVEALDVGVALGLEAGPVEGRSLLDGEAVGLGVVDGFGNGGSVEGDLFGNASSIVSTCWANRGGISTYPTLTQVPPRRLFSMTMALTPNLELAMRAEPRPPLPPPRTR